MVDREDSGALIRIAGIFLSVISACILLIKPFEYVTNTLSVYGLLLGAALLVIVGQMLTLSSQKSISKKAVQKRYDTIYDIITVGILIIIFTFVYIIPFVRAHTTIL